MEDIYLHTYISIIFDVFARTALQMFEVCNFIFFINQDFISSFTIMFVCIVMHIPNVE